VATVPANGVELHVSRFRTGPEGHRPIVVFVHGLGVVDGSSWSFMLGLHLAKDADVISYDLRGHGRSTQVPTGYTVADHVADLEALLDALGIVEPVHLVSASYGGAIATTMAIRHPDRVASLSLVDGCVPIDGWKDFVAATFGRFEEWLHGAASREQAIEQVMNGWGITRRRATNLTDRVGRMLQNTTVSVDLRREPDLSREDLALIRCPVMGIYGDESEIFHLTETLPQYVPDIRIHVIPGGDHLSVFWHTEELRTYVRQFIGLPEPVSPEREGSDLVASTIGEP
jgi:pimeloyl-ACP methyl ester carboxylesterase